MSTLLLWLLPIWGIALILVSALVLHGAARRWALILGPPLLFAVMNLASDTAFYNGNLAVALLYMCGWIALLVSYPVCLVALIAFAIQRHRKRRAAELAEPVPNLGDF